MSTKHILGSAAIAALIAGGAVAESHTTAETETDATSTAQVEGTVGDAGATAETGTAVEGEASTETEATDTGETEMAADPAAPEAMADAMVDVDIAEIEAEALTGARVYDQNDKWIGEISEVLIGADGAVSEVVIDIGGFLGIGEKPVALGFDSLSVKSDGDASYTVYVTYTEAELEAMPTYEG